MDWPRNNKNENIQNWQVCQEWNGAGDDPTGLAPL